MAIHNFAVAANEARNLEAELADRGAHAIHGGVVFARIARILDEAIDGPNFNVLRSGMREHTCPSKK